MTEQTVTRIVLLGAGHANLLALPDLRAALPHARITVIDAAERATYSGMFPGLVAGHYAPSDLRIDLDRIAGRYGAEFRRARITGIDPVARAVTLRDSEGRDSRLGYDVAALDVGSHTAMPEVPGFADHGVAIKPLDGFLDRLPAPGTGQPCAIIGGGIAGAEVALALARRTGGGVTLIEAGPRIAATLGARAYARLARALDLAGVVRHTQARAARVMVDALILQDGRRIDSVLTLGVAGARAAAWLARDLPVDGAGFVQVGPTLQVPGHPDLFAVGDCAAMMHAPRPKAGVFAVRQAPVLARNMAARVGGGAMAPYHPQRDYLKIVSLGGRDALAEWYGLVLHGRWLWRWKDRIDRRFMQRLQVQPKARQP